MAAHVKSCQHRFRIIGIRGNLGSTANGAGGVLYKGDGKNVKKT
jgi:hypothetical protein